MAAPNAASYSFTDDDVSRLAKCDDQTEFLLSFRRLLQSQGIASPAVFDAQTTLRSSTDYGASVLTKVFESHSHALHLEVGYALFQSCDSSSCLKLDSTTLPTAWLKENGVSSVLTLPKDTLSLFKTDDALKGKIEEVAALKQQISDIKKLRAAQQEKASLEAELLKLSCDDSKDE